MQYTEYQNIIVDDISTCLDSMGVQPILFFGSGMSQRYFNAPTWDGLLEILTQKCPKIDKSIAYYKQKLQNPIAIGTEFSEYIREWAWEKPAQFPTELFEPTQPANIYIKYIVANIFKDTCGSGTSAVVAEQWGRQELLKTGVRGKNGQYIKFSRIEPMSGTTYIQAEGETTWSDAGANSVAEQPAHWKPQKVLICFGPEHAPLEQRTVENAWQEARAFKPDQLLFCAFQFDEEAAKDIDELPQSATGMQLLKVQMNADLLTDDLRKKRSSNESFWLIGQPEVEMREIKKGDNKGKYQVEVLGFDYYNPKTGNVESGGKHQIAMWMLDTNYDGRSLFPTQVFFPMAGAKEGWATLARNLKAEIDEEKIEAFRGTESLPFEPGNRKTVAVKIVDDRGIERLKIIRI